MIAITCNNTLVMQVKGLFLRDQAMSIPHQIEHRDRTN